MIDRIAEGPHCGELGQGVALLSCLLSSFFHFEYFQSLLIAIYGVPVKYRSVCHSFGSTFFDPLFFSLSCSDIPHIEVTWSFFVLHGLV